MRHKLFDFRTAYIDLLLNVLTGIIFLFIITTMMIQTKKQNEGVKRDAQYIINVVWDPNVDCDVDIWVQDPNGQSVFFNRRDYDIMHIERDDMGHKNDFIKDGNGRITGTTKDNKETWVLRGVIPGEYYVSVHLYSCRYPGTNPLAALAMALKTRMDLPVNVELIRLNPYYDVIVTEKVVLRKIWDEITPFNFTLSAEGDVLSVDKTQHRLVRVQER